MAVIHIDTLLPPGRRPPGGERLAGKPVMVKFAELCEGKPAYFLGNELMTEAVAPDWRAAMELGSELAARSADVSVLVRLGAACLRQTSLTDFTDCVAAIGDVLERNWVECFPELEADEEGMPPDASVRLGALGALDDPKLILAQLSKAPLLLSAKGQPAMSIDELTTNLREQATFSDAHRDAAEAARVLLAKLLADVVRIHGTVHEKSSVDRGFELASLHKQVSDMLQRLTKIGRAAQAEPSAVSADVSLPSTTGTTGTTNDPLQGRKDAVALIERAIAYFERAEPSSPVPTVLKRAIALVGKDFWEVIAELGEQKLADTVSESRLFAKRS